MASGRLLISIRQVVSLAARRAFWPSRPIARLELVLRDDDGGGLPAAGPLVQIYAAHPGRADRLGDVLGRVGVPFDHVNLLFVQLTDDRLDADAANTHAGSDRIDALLGGGDGNLGALAGLPGDRTDFDHAVVDLRDLVLQQPPQEIAVGAG